MNDADKRGQEEATLDILLSSVTGPVSTPDEDSRGDLECAVRDISGKSGMVMRITAEIIVWPVGPRYS